MNTSEQTSPAGFTLDPATGDDATPPAGFIIDTRKNVYDPHDPMEPEWDGPTHTAETWKIKAQWNIDEGLTYFIDHAGELPWTPAELDTMQAVLADMRAGIE